MGEAQGNDSELLAAYAGGDASAFERIVAAHGGMVYATCLRVLSSRELAEEAAQAVFLVLARKAGRRGAVRGSLGSFLHGVARNVALRARASELARRERERGVARAMEKRREGQVASSWEDVRPHLDEAVEKLPGGERAAVVMHYLEGCPRAEVAERLGVPEGTVASRLHRAVGRMRGFLSGRDVTLSAVSLAALLAESAATPATPPFLLAAAGNIAAAGIASSGAVGAAGAGGAAVSTGVTLLAKGALKAMFWAKVKIAAAVLGGAAAVSTGVPAAVHAARAGGKPGTTEKSPAVAQPVAKEEVLKFRHIVLKAPDYVSPRERARTYEVGWTRQQAILRVGRNHATVRGDVKTRGGHAWVYSLKIDFKKEMILGAFKGVCSGSTKYTIEKVVERQGAELRVEIKFVQGETKDIGHPYDIVVCPRRELPVVFYENGKRLAEVLPFRRLTCKVALGSFKPRFGVYRSPKESTDQLPVMDGGKPRTDKWVWGGRPPDFGKEMVLAAFSAKSARVRSYRISRASVRDGSVRVDIASASIRGSSKGQAYDLVAVPRRDLPVVFYENGREIARVPFAAGKDKALEAFLPHVRNAQALAYVKYKEQLEGSPHFAGFTIDQTFLIYGSKPAKDGWKTGPDGKLDRITVPIANMDRKARPGDKLLVAWNAKDGPAAVKWTAARGKAVRSALAPGWRGKRGDYRCPWCRVRGFKAAEVLCAGCRNSTGPFRLCKICSVRKGSCPTCKRTVGPATRGVELGLVCYDPDTLRKAPPGWDPCKLTLKPGKTPTLWLSVKNKASGGKVPELDCWGGNLKWCDSLFFLAERPGSPAASVLFQQVRPAKGGVKKVPLKGSGLAALALKKVDMNGKPSLAKPGTYTLRAVAGRLVSNPVTVVVPGAKDASPPGGGALSGGEVLKFRRVRCPRINEPTCIVARTKEDARLHLARYYQPRMPRVKMTRAEYARRVTQAREAWLARLNSDWKKNMVIAVSRGYFPGHAGGKFQVAEIRASPKGVVVDLTWEKPRKDPGNNCVPRDMVVCPRRDVQVVFRERGKFAKVIATVPLRTCTATPKIPAPPTQADADAEMILRRCQKRFALLSLEKVSRGFLLRICRGLEEDIAKLRKLGRTREANELAAKLKEAVKRRGAKQPAPPSKDGAREIF